MRTKLNRAPVFLQLVAHRERWRLRSGTFAQFHQQRVEVVQEEAILPGFPENCRFAFNSTREGVFLADALATQT